MEDDINGKLARIVSLVMLIAIVVNFDAFFQIILGDTLDNLNQGSVVEGNAAESSVFDGSEREGDEKRLITEPKFKM